jgi:hypothetical protein
MHGTGLQDGVVVSKSLTRKLANANGNVERKRKHASHWSRSYTISNVNGSHINEKFRRQHLCPQQLLNVFVETDGFRQLARVI